MNRFIKLFSIPELRKRVLVVAGLLGFYRVLAAIPLPEIDPSRLASFFDSNGFLSLLNLFSGGGLSSLSLVMLGVSPYITASIIMQLSTVIFPQVKKMMYEQGAIGQAKFNRYTRFLTVPLAFVQGYGFLSILSRQGIIDQLPIDSLIINVLTVVAGSLIAMWIGELITEQKLGNGISLIIFAGIVAGLPQTLLSAYQNYTPDILIAYAVVAVLIIFGIVFLTEGERRIPVTYARQVRGNKLLGGASSYLPLKVNQAGMIPLIFAISVLLFPQFIAQAVTLFSAEWGVTINDWVNAALANQWIYGSAYFILVFAFTYFYTAVTFDPKEIAKNLQRNGGFVPGVRPGEGTQKMLAKILGRLTFWGAAGLAFLAVFPIIVQGIIGLISTGAAAASNGIGLDGAALLIVVGVALESMRQVDSQLSLREYENNS